MPGGSARLSMTLSISPMGPFRQVGHKLWLFFGAAIFLGICIHASQARVARSLSLVRGGRNDAAAKLTGGLTRAMAQAAHVQRIASPDARALEKLWEGWGRNTRLKGWGSHWLCNATGLKCNPKGRVSALRLPQMHLQGSVASAIGTLLSLWALDLSYNRLTGSLPSSLGRMSNLTYLSLSTNQLTGSLPSSLGRMSNLTYLSLSANQLTGSLPSSLGDMGDLLEMDLTYNQLTGSIPSSMGGMSSLLTLNLKSNQLSGSLPSSLGGMSSLTGLGLSNNQLTGSVPSSLGGMTGLSFLGLSYNRLTGMLPSNLGGMSNVAYLDLSSNQLTGRLPSSLGGMDNLSSLNLRFNQLNGSLPSSLGGMKYLQELDLSSNQITGILPSSLGGMSSLLSLNLSSNQLTGRLPSSLGLLSSLSSLDLSFNQLTGSLPSSLGRMGILNDLDLRFNQLAGTLPSTLGGMSSLLSLYLSFNQLTGSLPSSLGGMSSLIRLYLSYNHLNGSLPSTLGGMSSLLSLYLRFNELNGSLPASLGRMSSLTSLVLTSNKLTGSLPYSLQGMSGLQVLDLSSNQLTGSLHSSLAGMSNLQGLNLSSNRLTGSLPSCLGVMNSLTGLDLSFNQLAGSLPSCLGRMSSLIGLDLSSNQMTGIVPSAIVRMNSLTHLNASNNRFNGSLVPSIGDMYGLGVLDLSSNFLSGEVPVALSRLFGLSYLDLGHNSKLKANPSSLSGLAGLSRLQHIGLALPRLNGPLETLRLPLRSLTFLSLQGARNVTGTVLESAFEESSSLESLNLEGTAIQGYLPTSLALLSSLSMMKLPGRVLCPPGPCKDPTVARNQAFCTRCVAFCARCPAGASFRDSEVLLQFQAAAGLVPKIWTNSSFEGVSLDKSGHVQAISLPTYLSVQDLRLDLLPKATLRTLIISSQDSNDTLSTTLSCLSSLRMLDVSKTIYSIDTPSLGNLSSLRALNIFYSLLPDGELPSTLVSLRSLGMSSVYRRAPNSPRDTQLITRIPSPLSHFTKLTQLDLSKNSIQGHIPNFLSSLHLLANLDLSGNNFTGSVPESLSLLRKLTALNLGKNKGELSLPSSLATLPLVYLLVDKWKCLKHSGGTPCPPHGVNSSSPFCKRYCKHICAPCYLPPSPFPPLSPPPALPPPSPPPSPASDGNMGIIAGAASAAGVLVLLTGLALWYLLISKQRRPHDDVQKRGVRSLSAKEVEQITGSFGSFIGVEEGTELYEGETAQGQGVMVRVHESGRGRARKAAEVAFRQEVWLLSGIHHRSLQELHGYCLTPRKLFLVFEYTEQGTLWGMLREDPTSLTWSLRLRIALTAALGLDYLHSQLDPPLVHKDVKSRSVLVTAEFEGKVAAAGLGALKFGPEGASGYADPSKGEQGSPTAKCDVYAFGVVLLELATGIQPVEGETHILSRVLEMTASEEGLVRAIPAELQREREQPQQGCRVSRDTDITEGSAPLLTLEAFKCLLDLGVSCCSYKPHDRPSMAEVSSVIEELLQGESLPAVPFPAPGQVPFPEYAEPLRGPIGPTELLAISFTVTGNSHSHETSTSHTEKGSQ